MSRSDAPESNSERRNVTRETPCNSTGNWQVSPVDSGIDDFRDLCNQCFNDGEIPEHVDWLLYGTRGKHLHKSVDAGGVGMRPTGSGPHLAAKLKDDDVDSVSDLDLED